MIKRQLQPTTTNFVAKKLLLYFKKGEAFIVSAERKRLQVLGDAFEMGHNGQEVSGSLKKLRSN